EPPPSAASYRLKPQVSFKHAQHAGKIVAALEDEAGRRHHAVGALASGEPRVLLYAVKRHLAGMAKGAEYGLFAAEIDGIVAPFPGGDLAAVKIEDRAQLGARKENSAGNGGMGESVAAIDARAAARAELYRLGFAQRRLPDWTGSP